MIRQDPENILDPDRWLDKGELMELPKAPLGQVERRHIEPSVDQRNQEIPPKPALEIQIIPEDPEEIEEKGYTKNLNSWNPQSLTKHNKIKL